MKARAQKSRYSASRPAKRECQVCLSETKQTSMDCPRVLARADHRIVIGKTFIGRTMFRIDSHFFQDKVSIMDISKPDFATTILDLVNYLS